MSKGGNVNTLMEKLYGRRKRTADESHATDSANSSSSNSSSNSSTQDGNDHRDKIAKLDDGTKKPTTLALNKSEDRTVAIFPHFAQILAVLDTCFIPLLARVCKFTYINCYNFLFHKRRRWDIIADEEIIDVKGVDIGGFKKNVQREYQHMITEKTKARQEYLKNRELNKRSTQPTITQTPASSTSKDAMDVDREDDSNDESESSSDVSRGEYDDSASEEIEYSKEEREKIEKEFDNFLQEEANTLEVDTIMIQAEAEVADEHTIDPSVLQKKHEDDAEVLLQWTNPVLNFACLFLEPEYQKKQDLANYLLTETTWIPGRDGRFTHIYFVAKNFERFKECVRVSGSMDYDSVKDSTWPHLLPSGLKTPCLQLFHFVTFSHLFNNGYSSDTFYKFMNYAMQKRKVFEDLLIHTFTIIPVSILHVPHFPTLFRDIINLGVKITTEMMNMLVWNQQIECLEFIYNLLLPLHDSSHLLAFDIMGYKFITLDNFETYFLEFGWQQPKTKKKKSVAIKFKPEIGRKLFKICIKLGFNVPHKIIRKYTAINTDMKLLDFIAATSDSEKTKKEAVYYKYLLDRSEILQ